MKPLREMAITTFVGVAVWLSILVNARAGEVQLTKAEPDKISTWEGFERRDFKIDDRNCLLVVPASPAKGKPWIWRTEFFGHQPQADVALLHKGFHVAYMDVQNLYGAPVALDHLDKFYEHLTTVRGLAPKTVLEGFSRGGLFALNWAARHPEAHGRLWAEKVGAYLDKVKDKPNDKPNDGKKSNVTLRGSLTNSRIQFEKKKTGHVAFMGGSITEMNGYRPLVCDLLQRRFPETKFTFTNAGIASTCSTTGAFRLATDVLDKGPADLLFIEFAVNDDQDAGHAHRECIRGMEGIIRHVLAHNPNADIVLTYFVNPAMLKTIQDGKVPLTIASHEEVARHYSISSVNLAEEVADRIRAGTLTWERYGGVHPGRPGNELCAALIDDLLTRAWKEPLPAEAAAEKHRLPDAPLDANHYGAGRFIDPKKATLGEGWKLETPEWKKIPGQWRERFREIPLLSATKPGAELTLALEGRAIGAYLLAGPDAGFVEFSIDDGPLMKADLFHAFSRGLHYPRTVMFTADLKPGPHTLKLRLADQRNKASSGSAARIIQFVGN